MSDLRNLAKVKPLERDLLCKDSLISGSGIFWKSLPYIVIVAPVLFQSSWSYITTLYFFFLQYVFTCLLVFRDEIDTGERFGFLRTATRRQPLDSKGCRTVYLSICD